MSSPARSRSGSTDTVVHTQDTPTPDESTSDAAVVTDVKIGARTQRTYTHACGDRLVVYIDAKGVASKRSVLTRADGSILHLENNRPAHGPDGGPSLVDAHATQIWLDSDGKPHHDTEAAVIQANGTRIWYQHGIIARTDGLHTAEYADGSRAWHDRNGRIVRKKATLDIPSFGAPLPPAEIVVSPGYVYYAVECAHRDAVARMHGAPESSGAFKRDQIIKSYTERIMQQLKPYKTIKETTARPGQTGVWTMPDGVTTLRINHLLRLHSDYLPALTCANGDTIHLINGALPTAKEQCAVCTCDALYMGTS